MTPQQALEQIRKGDRRALARSLSYAESCLLAHHEWLDELWRLAAEMRGDSYRVGVTGAPGAGKSSLIEVLGMHAIGLGHRVAVLTVDPSSEVSGGSLLADKTRMARLGVHPSALVRPSASRAALGGVAVHTQESIELCELAGYDVTIVETVGVGQSETEVADLVDVLLLVLVPGAGDELQALKRGITEVADVVVVNKADGANKAAAARLARRYEGGLQWFAQNRQPSVLTASAKEQMGIEPLWQSLAERRQRWLEDGSLGVRRGVKQARQLKRSLERRWLERLWSNAERRQQLEQLQVGVAEGRLNLRQALAAFSAASAA